jgi:hypothetical protein
MMNLTYAWWLATMAWELIVYLFPAVTVALVVAVVAAVIFNCPFFRGRFRPRHLLVFAPLGIALLNLALGTVMRHEDTQSLAPAWPGRIDDGLLIVQFAAAIGVTCLMKGYRWFSVAVLLLDQWIGLAFWFVAGMSVGCEAGK